MLSLRAFFKIAPAYRSRSRATLCMVMSTIPCKGQYPEDPATKPMIDLRYTIYSSVKILNIKKEPSFLAAIRLFKCPSPTWGYFAEQTSVQGGKSFIPYLGRAFIPVFPSVGHAFEQLLAAGHLPEHPHCGATHLREIPECQALSSIPLYGGDTWAVLLPR